MRALLIIKLLLTYPPELADLVRDREARSQENQTLQSLVDELYHGRGTAVSFSPNMAGLVANYRAEYQSRVAAGELRIQELEKQSIQNQDTLRLPVNNCAILKIN